MLRRALGLSVVALVFLVLLAAPGMAHAEPASEGTVPVVVLALDSDDAEEQADALTGALRSQIRASTAWSLVETTQTLGMLMAALRCQGKPPNVDCLERIAAQVKSDRFVFGYVNKGKERGQVTAELHLRQKDKAETVMRETFADNLTDANDDALRAVAATLLSRLGEQAVGHVVVKLREENGDVVIDGDKRSPLRRGEARFDLAPGTHALEVPNSAGTKRNVLVTAGQETVVDLAPPPPPPTPSSEWSFPTRKVIGGTLVGGGIALFVIATINGLAWQDDKDKAEAHVAGPDNPLDGKAIGQNLSTLCDNQLQRKLHQTLCGFEDDRVLHSTVFWSTLAGGVVASGLGTYLLLSGGSSDEKKAGAAEAKKPRLDVSFARGGGTVLFSGSF